MQMAVSLNDDTWNNVRMLHSPSLGRLAYRYIRYPNIA